MLELRPSCECCDKDLPPRAVAADVGIDILGPRLSDEEVRQIIAEAEVPLGRSAAQAAATFRMAPSLQLLKEFAFGHISNRKTLYLQKPAKSWTVPSLP